MLLPEAYFSENLLVNLTIKLKIIFCEEAAERNAELWALRNAEHGIECAPLILEYVLPAQKQEALAFLFPDLILDSWLLVPVYLRDSWFVARGPYPVSVLRGQRLDF